MRRFVLAVALCLCACACAARQAQEAQRALIGRTLTEAESCMGISAHLDTRDNVLIAQWTHTQKSPTANIPMADVLLLPVALPFSLAGAGLSIGSDADCTVIATVREGRIAALRYAGADGGISGRHAACAPIVRGCLGGRP